MGKKDVISKEILKNIARDISKHILHIDIKDDMEIINQEFTRVESRESDLLFKNGDNIVHIEIQNNHHKQMHLRMCRYYRYYMDILFLYEDYKAENYGKTKFHTPIPAKAFISAHNSSEIPLFSLNCRTD